ncbi:MAG: c-type cytochrome [Ghiorsea sp.]|nr:c-type cytochrome [Ghiorsea sp.]
MSSSLILLALVGFSVSAKAGDINKGKALYDRLCVYCHLTTYDDKFGPGLGGILQRRHKPWLHNFLKDPVEMTKTDEYAKNLKENNEYGIRMPKLSEMQDKERREDIIAYLETLE